MIVQNCTCIFTYLRPDLASHGCNANTKVFLHYNMHGNLVFIAALKVTKLLYIGTPWPHGLQKRLYPFIAALKSHEITLHWYAGRPWAGSASVLKKIYHPCAGKALNGLSTVMLCKSTSRYILPVRY
jgi:hypothetical protein